MKQRSFLLLLLCFVFLSSVVASVSAQQQQQCMNRGVYGSNSTYEANLRLILSLLPSNVTAQDGFFYNGSIGQEPNRVYATGMCIPGLTSGQCSVCIKTASDGLIKVCLNQVEGYTWTSEPTLCFVRYSKTSFFGSADLDPLTLVYNPGNTNSNLTEFKAIWDDLVVRMIAASSTAKNTPSSSSNHYTVDVAALTPIQNLYALMQCTLDVSSRDCENCLRHPSCCGQRQGGIIMMPNCIFRWDLYAFYKAFDNLSVPSPPPRLRPYNGSRKLSTGAIVAIVIPIVALIIFVLLIRRSVVLCWRRKPYQEFDLHHSGISAVRSLQYDFKAIETATDKFSNKLGQGGFGEVFKGTLLNGTEVAVKRLSKTSSQGAQEFKNEVVVVAKLQHRNLVKLHGFCLEGEEKILVYEFLPNRSLDYFLFDPTKKGELDWTKRYNIIGGITRGIIYLHQDSRLTIIHRDLKASNVLLDADMNPKIADFGMARIFGMDQTHENTSRVVGTYGYMSPEYAMNGQFSMKSDVYSFGVLVLEIISGRKNSIFYATDGTHGLVTHAWRLWSNGTALDLLDPVIVENCQKSEVVRCIHIGLLCVQEDPVDRPTMQTIFMMLTSNTVTLPVPQQPGFFVQSRPERDPLDTGQSTTTKYVATSVDDSSITILYPR